MSLWFEIDDDDDDDDDDDGDDDDDDDDDDDGGGGDILQLLLTMMTYAYHELDDYDDMMLMVTHVWMMTRVSITTMMIITCGLIDADCLHTTSTRSTNNSVLGAAIYDNIVGNGINWGPVTSLSGVGVGDFRVEITM